MLVLLAHALTPNTALGLTDEEVFRDLRFNFINPGGRSLGMGGAFISLADDATAAQANPSGLATLLSPQLFVEVRWADTDPITTTHTFRDPIDPDTGFDVRVLTEPDPILGPSFLAYVRPRDRWSFAFSRQELLHTENTTTSTYDFLFAGESDSRSAAGTIDLELVNWNVSAAYRVIERVRLGATVSVGVLDMRSTVVNSYVDPTGNLIGDPGLAGVPFEMYRTTADDDDVDVTFSLGVLWAPRERLNVGASYRQGGSFGIDQTLQANPIDPDLVPGMIASQVFFNETDTLLTPSNDTATFENEIHVPDVLGLGLSGRPIPRLVLALDAVYVRYSNLVDDFNSRLNVLTAGFETEEAAAFTIDDQTNLHLGAEVLLWPEAERTRVLVRAGVHQDKDNRLRSDFAPGGFGLASNENFPGRDDVTHYSAGVGVVVGNHFQLDAAVDYAEIGVEGVLSWIYKF